MVYAIGVLSIMNVIEGILIWKLLDRLLLQAHIPTLGPVLSTPPAEPPKPKETRHKLFSVRFDQ